MTRSCQSGPRSGDRGGAFTLIEIIIAMTIIAVIAAVAVPTLQGLNAEEKVRAPLTTLAGMVEEVRSRALHEHRPYTIYFERDGIHALAGNRDFAKREEFLKYLEELRTPPEITEFDLTEPERIEAEHNDASQPAGLKPLKDKVSSDPATNAGSGTAAGAARSPDSSNNGSGSPEEGKGKRRQREMPWTQSIILNGTETSTTGSGGNGTAGNDRAAGDKASSSGSSIKTPANAASSGSGVMQAAVLLWGDGEWDDLDGDRLRRWVFQSSGMASPAQVRLTTGGMELEAAFDPLTGELVRERIRPAQAGRR